MLRPFLGLSLISLACAAGPPAKSADEAPSEASGEESASEPSAKSDAPAEEASPAKASSSAAPASQDDARDVLQLVIDDEALTPYLHLDKPDRFPLRVAGSALPQGIELTKATKPVIIVSDLANEKKPVLVFTEINIEGDDASVRYRYDVEKVRGASTLKRREGHWVLTRSRVTEH